MIDNRIENKAESEIEISLANITDTRIMLNFQEVLSKVYPHLIPIGAYCYDSWDNIVENLYDEMVLNTLCWKYGISFDRDKFHRYAYCYGFKYPEHHIECFFNGDSIKVLTIFGEWSTFSKSYFVNKKIIFKEFSDGINNLTGSISKKEAERVGFHLVDAFLLNLLDGGSEEVFLDTRDVSFELVLENI